MNRNCHVFTDRQWAILPPLQLAVGGIWAFPTGFPIPFKSCPETFLSLQEFPSSFPIPLQPCPSGFPTAFESISQLLLAKTWQFQSLFSYGLHFCYHLLKGLGVFKNFKNHQRTDLSNKLAFRQFQSHATVPLIGRFLQYSTKQEDSGKQSQTIGCRLQTPVGERPPAFYYRLRKIQLVELYVLRTFEKQLHCKLERMTTIEPFSLCIFMQNMMEIFSEQIHKHINWQIDVHINSKACNEVANFRRHFVVWGRGSRNSLCARGADGPPLAPGKKPVYIHLFSVLG